MNLIHVTTDLIIAIIFFYATGLAVTLFCVIKHVHCKKFLPVSILVICICLLSFLTYGLAIEPFHIIRKEETFDLDEYDEKHNGDNPLKFIVISDLHIGRYLNGKKTQRIVEIINEEEDIDYVLILGDIINGPTQNFKELEVLKHIDSDKQVIFIYGNHDYSTTQHMTDHGENKADLVKGLEDKLKSLNFTILKNEAIVIEEHNGNKIVLAGIEDIWSEQQNYSFLEDLNTEDLVIFLGHNPDCIMDITEQEKYKRKVDIVLSGHTHGGEMRMPVIGSIAPQGLPTELPDTYDKGWFNYKGIPLFITSGTGNCGVRMRTFNPPEVIILTIK